MKVTLYIDENKMGDIKVGMEAKITVDAYPYKKPWKGKIVSLGLSKAELPANQSQSSVAYQAEILIDNADRLLRPGMTVHAKITMAKVKQVLAVPGFVFQLNPKVLEGAAKIMGYEFKPIDHAKKKELINHHAQHPIKMLWVKEDKALVEKPVTIGVTDNAYFQVLAGVQETDDIITDDMTASDEIKKLAKQMAGS
jgi:HlyD family secretion protein